MSTVYLEVKLTWRNLHPKKLTCDREIILKFQNKNYILISPDRSSAIKVLFDVNHVDDVRNTFDIRLYKLQMFDWVHVRFWAIRGKCLRKDFLLAETTFSIIQPVGFSISDATVDLDGFAYLHCNIFICTLLIINYNYCSHSRVGEEGQVRL